MDMLIIACNFIIPMIMILIGFIYSINTSKNIDSLWILIVSAAMMVSGFSDGYEVSKFSKNIQNKKYGFIWIISGLILLIFSSVLLISNKEQIKSLSSSLLELECIVLVAIFIIVEYFLKRKKLKKDK